MKTYGRDINTGIFISVLEHLNEAVYLIDTDGTVCYVNDAAAKLEHMDKDWMIGKSVAEVYQYTDIDIKKNAPCLNVLRSGKPQVGENIEWFTKDGIMVNAITSSYPIFSEETKDRVIGSFSITEDIREMKRRLIENGAVQQKNTYRLKKNALKNGTSYTFDDIIAESDVMVEMISTAKRFAAKKMPVMIYGETGTGKEMIAQSIHNASPFLKNQFVPVNCAAIPENLLESILFGTVKGAFTGAVDNPGLFEKAENGTVFLDEINSMPIGLQAKILRALQEKEFRRVGDNKIRKINCRFICATNKQPMEAIRSGELREDLFYRLSTGMIFVAPLRERGRDLTLLLHYFIDKCNTELDSSISQISNSLLSLFRSYQWLGNIRELANVVESAMNMTSVEETVLDVHHLPNYLKNHFFEEINAMPNALTVFSHQNDVTSLKQHNYPVMDFNGTLKDMVSVYEKTIIETALAGTAGNLTHCGKKLDITRQGLMKKIKKYGIDLDRFKR